jgi:hypothetical protein
MISLSTPSFFCIEKYGSIRRYSVRCPSVVYSAADSMSDRNDLLSKSDKETNELGLTVLRKELPGSLIVLHGHCLPT